MNTKAKNRAGDTLEDLDLRAQTIERQLVSARKRLDAARKEFYAADSAMRELQQGYHVIEVRLRAWHRKQSAGLGQEGSREERGP